jgi:hypothetical protein
MFKGNLPRMGFTNYVTEYTDRNKFAEKFGSTFVVGSEHTVPAKTAAAWGAVFPGKHQAHLDWIGSKMNATPNLSGS